MPRGELHRSGFISMGDNTPEMQVDETTNPDVDSFGPVPEANRPGHHPERDDPDREDPDKPIGKFRDRFPADEPPDEPPTDDPAADRR